MQFNDGQADYRFGFDDDNMCNHVEITGRIGLAERALMEYCLGNCGSFSKPKRKGATRAEITNWISSMEAIGN
jgi:hypothetical protein